MKHNITRGELPNYTPEQVAEIREGMRKPLQPTEQQIQNAIADLNRSHTRMDARLATEAEVQDCANWVHVEPEKGERMFAYKDKNFKGTFFALYGMQGSAFILFMD